MSQRTLRYLTLSLLLCTCGAVLAQAQTAGLTRPRPLTITASLTAAQVRFAALSEVAQLRLEVWTADGVKVFDSEFQFGNMLDWNLRNQQDQGLADGAYQCVVTARDFAGRLIERRGTLRLLAGQANLETGAAADGALAAPNPLTALERPDFLALLSKQAGLATTLLAHDGQDGRLVSGSGALSFRTGNFFAGQDVEQMRLTPEGNLGLGVRAPQARLDVAGLIRTSEGIQFPDGTVQRTAAGLSASDTALRGASQPQRPQATNAPAGTVGALAKFTSPTTLDDSTIFEVGGNIGVGTPTPGGVFDLQRASSSDLLQRFWNTGNGGAKLRYVSQTGASAQIQLTDLAEWLSAIAGNNTIGLQFRVRDSSAPNTEAQLDASARMTILRNGNVGIGTTSPSFPLSVAGIIQSTNGGFRFPDGTVQTTAAGTGVSSLNGLAGPVTLAAGANVTITPVGNTLTIAAPGSGVSTVTASAPLASSGGTNPNLSLTGIVPIANGGTGVATGAINNSTALQPANFNISGNGFIGGNVGIGTTSPQAKLDVNGDLQVSGNIAAKYQDVAEWVPARQTLAVGTVVSLDLSRPNTVRAASRAYDAHVAGVISAQPGLLLGEAGAGKVLVATTGRVKVKVDATRYPIKIGDLLVTSHQSGLAMKSRPLCIGGARLHRPGTILGKALEPLAKGRGEILVLLSLQ